MNAISNLEGYQEANYLTYACGTLNTVVSFEMALQAIESGCAFALNRYPFLSEAMSMNFGGSILFGLSALNIIPGSSMVAACSFIATSLLCPNMANSYLSSKAIHTFANHVFYPLCEALAPLVEKIAVVTIALFETIALIPYHPIWAGVALLATAIFIKQVVIPQVAGFFSEGKNIPTSLSSN